MNTVTATIGYGLPSRRVEWVLAAIVLVALGAVYADVGSALAATWRSNPMYSYGVLIPVISGYLVWMRRHRIRDLEVRPSSILGWPLLAIGLASLLVGKAGGVMVVQELSLIPTLAGVVLLVLGRSFFQALWGPILYLVFMIPVWDGLTEHLHQPFQMFSAENGLRLLNLFGIPAYRDGVFLELPNLTLEVARACSGVNYLIAVFAIGLPLAMLYLDTWMRRVALLTFAIVIAIAANSLRVALIGVLAYYEIGSPLHGPFHLLQGLFVSLMGYGAIFLGLWVLSRGGASERTLGIPPPSTPATTGPVIRTGVLSGLVVVCAGLGWYVTFAAPTPIALGGDLAAFPRQIGEWFSTHGVQEAAVPVGFHPDHELRRRYIRASGEEIEVYLGYFESQTQGKELVNHQTATLHLQTFPVQISVPDGGHRVVNGLVHSDQTRSYVALFWYDLNGRVVADRYWAKVYTIWDALVHRRTNGTVVWLKTNVAGEIEKDQAIMRLAQFAGAVYSVLDGNILEPNSLAVAREVGVTS